MKAIISISDSPMSADFPPPGLLALAAHISANRMWVQGAGGNVSAKVADVLWIKGSGKWMSSAYTQPIFAAVRLSGVRRRMAAGEVDPAAPEVLPVSPAALRPSIETSLHALLPHPYVMHVHSVNVIAHSVCAQGIVRIERRLQGLRWAGLPYARPGVELTDAIASVLQRIPVDVLILANHGLVIGGATPSAVETLLNDVEERLNLPARIAPPPAFRALEDICTHTLYRPAPTTELHAMALDSSQRSIAVGGSLYPDHVVFLGPSVLSVEHRDVGAFLKAHAKSESDAPAVILVPEMGVLLRRDLTAGAQAMVECLAMVLARIPGPPIRYLTPDQEAALVNWEAEKYRRGLP